jgi:beta-lactamase class A
MLNPINAQSIDELNQYLQSVKDSVEISFIAQDIKGEILAAENQIKKIPSASMIKIPILITLFEERDKNNISFDETYKIKPEDIVGGSGELNDDSVSKEFTIYYLANEMIRVSDNSATNILIKKLGFEEINNSIKKKGLSSTKLNRLMMDFDAVKEGRENYTSAQDLNKLLLNIYNGHILSQNTNDTIITILKSCADKNRTARNLPTNIEVANKTGSLDYVCGDAAIIFSPKPIILSIVIENFSSEEQAEIIMGKIAGLIVKIFGGI